jgi:hypothetical protein
MRFAAKIRDVSQPPAAMPPPLPDRRLAKKAQARYASQIRIHKNDIRKSDIIFPREKRIGRKKAW